jgi:hypothetical protein
MDSDHALLVGPIETKRKRSLADGGNDYRTKIQQWCLARDVEDQQITGEKP